MDSVKLESIIDELDLEPVYLSTDYKDIEIHTSDINRPGLQLMGYYKEFDHRRIQIIGEQEWYYLDEMESKERCEIIDKLFEQRIPALVVLRNHKLDDDFIEVAKKRDITILTTKEPYSKFAGRYQNYVEVMLAPTIRKHGVLLDVYGVGVLITGKSGVGKSETALDLISKGARLISDDSVIIKRIDDRLIGKSPIITKHFMEIRGVGIIDIQRLFGIGYVMESKPIEMIVNLVNWDEEKDYERLGIDDEYEQILGINVVKYTIPVKPGRHIGLIIEVAAKNYKQKEMGYNPAVELNKRILQSSKKQEWK